MDKTFLSPRCSFIKTERESVQAGLVLERRTPVNTCCVKWNLTLYNNWNNYLPTQLPNLKPGNCQYVLLFNLLFGSILYIKFIQFLANGRVWDSAAANAVSTTANCTNTINSSKSVDVHFFSKAAHLQTIKFFVFLFFCCELLLKCVCERKYFFFSN